MSANYDQLKAFRDKFSKVTDTQKNLFMEECLKELAARLLAKVIKRTPVGVYPSGSGKTGGTLRRGWTGGERFMLTISEKEIREAAPAILEAKIEKWLVGLLK